MKKLNSFGLAVLTMFATLLTSCVTPDTAIRESNPNRKFTVENVPIHVRAVAEYVNPQAMPTHPLNGNTNFIELINEKAFVDLPYFGRVYFPKYSNDGTSFAEPYTDMKVTRTKRDDGAILSFKLAHEGIKYDVVLTLYDGGMMDLAFTPDCASTCYFTGTWYESQLYDKEGNPVTKNFY